MIPNPYSFQCKVRGRFAVPLPAWEAQLLATATDLSALGEDLRVGVSYQPSRARTLHFMKGKVLTAAAIHKRVETASAKGKVFSLDLLNPPGLRGEFGDRIDFGFNAVETETPALDVTVDWTEDDMQSGALVDVLVAGVERFIAAAGVVAGAGWFGAHQAAVDPYLAVTVAQAWRPRRDSLVGYSLIVVLNSTVLAHLGGVDAVDALPAEVKVELREPDGEPAIITALRRRPYEIDSALLAQWRQALLPALPPQPEYRTRYVPPRPPMILPEDWPVDAPDADWSESHHL